MPQFENHILGTATEPQALDAMIARSTDALLKRKDKKRLIPDMHSTVGPARGYQERVA